MAFNLPSVVPPAPTKSADPKHYPPSPSPSPTPSPARGGGMSLPFTAGGGMSPLPDLSNLSNVNIVQPTDFTAENPGSFDLQPTADTRSLLEDLYTAPPAGMADDLEILAIQRKNDAANVVKMCDALEEIVKADSEIAIKKLNTRDAVADEQVKVGTAIAGSLKKGFTRAEKVATVKADLMGALGISNQNLRKTAAQIGMEYTGGGR